MNLQSPNNLRILIVGFGSLARELSNRIKHFPEYGMHGKIAIYHIFVRRNSLSYGKNLVVEIPDPHGDGYRTYRDGLQALDNYSTTVSNYKPWLLEEATNGSFNILLDCTDGTIESYSLISEILSYSDGKCSVIPSNLVGIDATIDELRRIYNGNQPWEPIVFTKEFLKDAANAWSAAECKMAEYHLTNKTRDVERRAIEIAEAGGVGWRSCFSAIPSFDVDLISKYVIKGEAHEEYERHEFLDEATNCLIIKHGILDKFFGWHHTEQLAAREFMNPNLKIESATYIKYLSESPRHVAVDSSKYVIEYVYKGKLDLIETDGSSTKLTGGSGQSSYSYQPVVDQPAMVNVSPGTEVIVFTYKETSNDD